MAGLDLSHTALWSLHRLRMVSVRESRCRYACGVHWLVKSPRIQVQARYSNRNTWVEAVAISGSFLHNHKLMISNRGKVTWDGAVVVDTFPSAFSNEFVELRYFSNQVFQKVRRVRAAFRTMQIELPEQVSLTVNVASYRHIRFLDVFVTMPKPAGGVDGHCGKADGDLSDDTQSIFLQRIRERFAHVPPQESFFGHHLLLAANTAERLGERELNILNEDDADCQVGTQEVARSLCNASMPEGSAAWLDSCAEDVCAGGEELVNHTSMLRAQVERTLGELARAASTSTLETCHTCTPGEACFQDVEWALNHGVYSGTYQALKLSPMIDASSCFEEVQQALSIWLQHPDFFSGGMRDKSIPLPCGPEQERHQKHGLWYCR